MPYTDQQLLDFDATRLADFDRSRAEELLRVQGELFRNHLAMAKWIDGWRARAASRDSVVDRGSYDDGVQYALREMAAHLRQGDLLTDGVMIREESERP